MKKILLVFGTRPEAIKMARLVQILRELSSEFNLIVCVTAQHREMLDQVLGSFKIKPDIDLNLMTSGQDLASITSSIILNMQSVINLHKPELVLVHGDTTTAFATSLASFYCRVPVGHHAASSQTNRRSFNHAVAAKKFEIYAKAALEKFCQKVVGI
jgi:UDP-N-acetylglucosamine 2-epimerase (non-hydrolysing)